MEQGWAARYLPIGDLALFAAPALGLGELGDAVAVKDTFERDARLIPDLARRARRRIIYVVTASLRIPGWADLAVQHLHDVEHRHFLGRYRQAIPTVRPATALEDAAAPQLPEDLLEKPLRYAPTARDLGHPKRRTAPAQSDLHHGPRRVLALLRQPHVKATRYASSFAPPARFHFP